MKLRDDLKWSDSLLNETIEIGMDIFCQYFQEKEMIVEFINSFKSHKDAEIFIGIIRSIYYLENAKDPLTRLVLRLAILETIGNSNFEQFPDWFKKLNEDDFVKTLNIHTFTPIQDLNELKTIIYTFKEKYLDEHGSRRAILKVIDNNLTEGDKISFAAAFREKNKESYDNLISFVSVYSKKYFPEMNKVLEKSNSLDEFMKFVRKKYPSHLFPLGIHKEGHFPNCYDYRYCEVFHGSCFTQDQTPKKGFCKLVENPEALIEEVKHLINLLYSMRTDFVHSGIYNYWDEADIFTTIVNNKLVTVTLKRKEFDELIKKCVINYFRKIIENNLN